MKRILLFLLMIAASISMISCIEGEEPHDVYVTVYPMKYVTEQIFQGTDYTVGIVPGVTSHENSVDWSPKEIIAMTEATYLFYVGANYDQYIDFQISSIFTDKQVELVKMEDQTDYIQFIQGVVHLHEEEAIDTVDDYSLGLDPHFWVSPLKVKEMSQLIYEKLILKFDDPNGLMEANYMDLCERLQTLSDEFQAAFDTSDQIIMTSTNVYGYLRADYGMNYISISPGYHEETEQFTTQEKEELVNHAIEDHIKYIIYEKYTSSPLSNAVFAEMESLELNPQKLEFHILQALTDDDIEAGEDYITVMYNNLDLLKLALVDQSE